MKHILPNLIQELIDNVKSTEHDLLTESTKEMKRAIKSTLEELELLKWSVLTNQPLQVMQGSTSDVLLFNKYLEEQTILAGEVRFFNAIFLHAETYVHMRITEIFLKRFKNFRHLEPCQLKKQSYFYRNMSQIKLTANYFTKELIDSFGFYNAEDHFENLLKLSIWNFTELVGVPSAGSDCDLPEDCRTIGDLSSNILINQCDKIWQVVMMPYSKNNLIDIVLDNFGVELFTDLCIADFLIMHKLASKVRFYPKTSTFYVKTTSEDLYWMFSQLKNSESEDLQNLSDRWLNYCSNDLWSVEEHNFWILPHDVSHMAKLDPALYAKFVEAKLVIFKGDFNCRKLLGDKNFDPTVPIAEAVEKSFQIGPLAIIRAITSELIVGFPPDLAQEVQSEDVACWGRGKYGVIQYDSI